MPGHCPKCGTLLDNGFCHECKTKIPKKVLIIHFNNGDKKQLHNVADDILKSFITFMEWTEDCWPGKGDNWPIFNTLTTNLRKNDETIYIPRKSVSYFEVREVAE